MRTARALRRIAPALALVLTAAPPSLAQTADPVEEAKQLFQQGRDVRLKAGCEQAIPLFRKSQSLYAARGTLFNLAECEAEVGRVASASQHFQELLAQLPPDDERTPVVKQRLAELTPRVPRLVIELAAGAPPPAELRLDGEPLSPDRLGGELRIDPGAHTLTATWSGGETKEIPLSLAEGARQVVTVAPAPAAPPPPAAPSQGAPAVQPLAAGDAGTTADSAPSGQRTLAFIAGGIGIAGLGVGAVTGILAIGTKSDLEEACPNPSPCGQEGLDLASKGQTLTTTSTIAFVVGLAGVGAGVALLLTAPAGPSSSPGQAALTPMPLPGGGGALLRGRF